MKVLISEKLSPHRYKTPEGYLICTDAILARTGKQTYRRSEIFNDDDDTEIEVDRPAEEVFSASTLASFENKPIVVEHPDEDVNAENHNKYAVGFARDVRRGVVDGKDVMLATIVITDAQTIEEIENGEHTDLSCGYDCDINDDEHPCQRNIRGNHIALCQHGRAGIARLVDSVKDDQRLPAKIKNELKRILHAKSTFIRNKDYDVSEFVRDVERWFKIDGTPIKLVRESINGWNKMTDGMMRKDYVFSVEGYVDRFMLSIYADPNTWHTTELNGYFLDSVKDAMFEVWYVDRRDNKQMTYIKAVDQEEARRKVQKMYGPYRIYEVRKVADDMKNINDKLIEIPEDRLRSFEEQMKMRKIHVVSRGRTMMGRIHYQVEFGGPARQLAKLLNELDGIMDRQNIPMTYSAGDNDNDYSTAGIDLDKMYVKDCEDEDPYEESTEGLEEAEKKFHDEMICNTETDCKDEQSSELGDKVRFRNRVYVIIKVQKGKSDDVARLTLRPLERFDEKDKPFDGGGDSYWDIHIERWQLDDSCKEAATKDSVKDAKTEYVFNYQDTYHRTRDKMRVDANNLDEAIREFGKIMALGGFGTANIYVVSVSPNDGYMRAYGKLSEMLKQKWTRDSCKKNLDSEKLLSIVAATKAIKTKDAKETKLTFEPTNDVANIDMTNAMIGKLVSSGIDYHSARKNAGKYSVVILGGDDIVRKAKLIIENIGFFSKWA